MAEAKKKAAAKSGTSKKPTTVKKPAAKKSAAPKKTAAPKKSPPSKKAAPKKAAPAKKTAPAKQKASQKPVQKSRRRLTIAQRTARRRERKSAAPAVLAMLALTAAAAFFQFCVAGYSFSALLCIVLALIIGFYTFVPRLFPSSKAVIRLFTFLLCIVLAAACVTEAFIIKASFGSPDTACDYLVVLGAKVRSDGPSLSLNNRIDAACDYLTAHPATVAVVSGGQGPDEPMTEAVAMYNGLVSRGIDPARIWLEEKATSTWENLQFSLALIEEKCGHRPDKIAVVSSEYHLFRAGLFTRAAGAEFIGVPAKTTLPILKVNYFLREVAGVWHYYLLGGNYHA